MYGTAQRQRCKQTINFAHLATRLESQNALTYNYVKLISKLGS